MESPTSKPSQECLNLVDMRACRPPDNCREYRSCIYLERKGALGRPLPRWLAFGSQRR